jgi:hypothetical protein
MQDMGAFDVNAQDHLKMVDKLKFLKQTVLTQICLNISFAVKMGHEKVFEQASLKLLTWTWCNMLFTYIKGIVNLGICYQQGEASTLEGYSNVD